MFYLGYLYYNKHYYLLIQLFQFVIDLLATVLLIFTNIFTFSLYLNMKKSAKMGLESTLKVQEENFELNKEIDSLKKELETLKGQ